MIDDLQLIVPDTDPRTLDSVFRTPGQNEPCHCGSGTKYKRCHETVDQKAYSAVVKLMQEANAAYEMTHAMPKARCSKYDPDPT